MLQTFLKYERLNITMDKKVLILLLVLILLFIFGCIDPPTFCGDGVCQIGEDQYSCPEDCGLPPSEDFGTLIITVLDEETSQPISDAGIQIIDEYESLEPLICTTDSEGKCTKQLDESTYTIIIQKTNYQTQKINHIEILINQTITKEVILKSTADLESCYDRGGSILEQDWYNQENPGFRKITTGYFYGCDGETFDSLEGICCVGNIESAKLPVYSNNPTREDFQTTVGFNFTFFNEIPQSIEYTHFDGSKEILELSNISPDHPQIEIDELVSHGEQNANIKILDGIFAGKEVPYQITGMTEAELAQECLNSNEEAINTTIQLKGEKEARIVKTTGRLLNIIGEDGEEYIVDKWVLENFSQINGKKLSAKELQDLTLEDSFIIKMKAAPALDTINYDEIIKSATKTKIYTTLNSAYQQVSERIPAIEQAQNQVINRIENLGATLESRYKYSFNGFSITINQDNKKIVLSELKNNSQVEYIYADTKVEAILDESVPMIDANTFWETYGMHGEGISIGIIDTGIDYTHSDLGGCIGTSCKVKGGYDFIDHDSDPMDAHGHGTHVAGIAASDGLLKGVAPKADLYGIRVLDARGFGSSSGVIQGIEWAIDPNGDGDISDHLDIINLSLGGGGTADTPDSQAINRASNAGIVPVVAAGNDGGYGYWTIGSPGAARNALTVGAVLDPTTMAYFSSKGPALSNTNFLMKPDVSAPGVNICSSQYATAWEESECFDDDHTAISGTSMATPHVAGIAALLKQLNPTWTNLDIKSSIVTTADELTEYDYFTQGTGLANTINASNAKVSFYPTSIDLNAESNETIQIKNLSNRNQKIILPTSTIVNNIASTKREDATLNFIYSENEICLSPGETHNIGLIGGLNEYGVYGGKLPVQIQDNCDGPIINQDLLVSFTNAKRILLNIETDQDSLTQDTFITYETRVMVMDQDGNYITGNYTYGTVDRAISSKTLNINIFRNIDFVTILYQTIYDIGAFEGSAIYTGTKEVDISSGNITLNIDEKQNQLIENNYKTFFEEKGLWPSQAEYFAIPIINGKAANPLFYGYQFGNEVCPSLNKNFSLKRITSLDGEMEFKIATGSTKIGSSYSDANEIFLYPASAKFPSEQNILFGTGQEIQIDYINHNILNQPTQDILGIGSYVTTSWFVGTGHIPNVVKNKKITYEIDENIGYWIIGRVEINQTDPVLRSRDFLSLIAYTQDLFNGKTRAEFNGDTWEDIPTGELISPIEFMKSPLELGNSLTNYNGYLQQYPLFSSAYRNSTIDERFWSLYTFDYVEPYRPGKIRITTPSQQIIDSNGLNFFLNCNTDLGWPLIPCEDGEYRIIVDMDNDFVGTNQTKEYFGIMNSGFWQSYGVVE